MTDRETPAGAVEALERAISDAGDLCGDTDDGGYARLPGGAEVLAHLPGYSLTRSVDVERWQRIETAAREWDDADAELDAITEGLTENYAKTGEQGSDDALLREATAEDRLNRAESALRDSLGEG